MLAAHRPPARCTIAAYDRWVRQHAHDGHVRAAAKPWMWRLEACVDREHGPRARLSAIRSRMRFLRVQAWNVAHPWQTAEASWYQDAGQTASGWHATYGFAACGDGACVPFGTRIRFCLHGCVTAVRDDSGPYVPGRSFDLGASTASAIGFSGVQTVRFRVLP